MEGNVDALQRDGCSASFQFSGIVQLGCLFEIDSNFFGYVGDGRIRSAAERGYELGTSGGSRQKVEDAAQNVNVADLECMSEMW